MDLEGRINAAENALQPPERESLLITIVHERRVRDEKTGEVRTIRREPIGYTEPTGSPSSGMQTRYAIYADDLPVPGSKATDSLSADDATK